MQAIKELADRLDGKPAQMLEHSGPDSEPITKVVNEIVHVYETREQIEFNDQTPLLEINPSKNGGNTHYLKNSKPLPCRPSGRGYRAHETLASTIAGYHVNYFGVASLSGRDPNRK